MFPQDSWEVKHPQQQFWKDVGLGGWSWVMAGPGDWGLALGGWPWGANGPGD